MANHRNTWQRIYNNSVLQENGCREWKLCKDKDGYGVTSVLGKKMPAHRALWGLWRNFEELNGKYVLHLCNNPSCVNIDHLYLGDQKQNVQDQIKAGTFVRGSKNGKALLDAESVKHIRSSGFSTRSLAKYYDVSYHTIWDIRKGRSWQHLK